MATKKYTEAFPYFFATLPTPPTPILDVPDNFPATVGGAAGNEVEVRMQETLPAGTYQIGFSAINHIDSTNNAIVIRISTDGGSNWLEFWHKADDTGLAVRTHFDYHYPIIYSAPEVIDWIIQVRKDAATNQLDCRFVNIMVQKVGDS
jgi:hypothetical protein